MTNSKTCWQCQKQYPLNEFHHNKKSLDKHSSKCKYCTNARTQELRKLNPQRLAAERARWNEKRRGNQKKSLKVYANSKEYRQAYYQKNKAKFAESSRRYYQNNPHLNRLYAAAYKARRRNNGVFQIIQKDMRALRNSPCYYCGIKNYAFTLDHVIPISKGGRHGIGNLVACCKSCNSSKKDKYLSVWKAGK